MIYAVQPKIYPNKEQLIEEISYNDENDFEWKIARVVNGFFVRYFGDTYFSPEIFVCDGKNETMVKIKNTRCLFVQNTEFDAFCEFREILKNGFTDDIWDAIQDLFSSRFECSLDIIESEII